MKLADAVGVHVGATPAVAVYVGAVKVWPAGPTRPPLPADTGRWVVSDDGRDQMAAGDINWPVGAGSAAAIWAFPIDADGNDWTEWAESLRELTITLDGTEVASGVKTEIGRLNYNKLFIWRPLGHPISSEIFHALPDATTVLGQEVTITATPAPDPYTFEVGPIDMSWQVVSGHGKIASAVNAPYSDGWTVPNEMYSLTINGNPIDGAWTLARGGNAFPTASFTGLGTLGWDSSDRFSISAIDALGVDRSAVIEPLAGAGLTIVATRIDPLAGALGPFNDGLQFSTTQIGVDRTLDTLGVTSQFRGVIYLAPLPVWQHSSDVRHWYNGLPDTGTFHFRIVDADGTAIMEGDAERGGIDTIHNLTVTIPATLPATDTVIYDQAVWLIVDGFPFAGSILWQ